MRRCDGSSSNPPLPPHYSLHFLAVLLFYLVNPPLLIISPCSSIHHFRKESSFTRRPPHLPPPLKRRLFSCVALKFRLYKSPRGTRTAKWFVSFCNESTVPPWTVSCTCACACVLSLCSCMATKGDYVFLIKCSEKSVSVGSISQQGRG